MTRLYDRARAYAAAHPTRPPSRTSGTWDQLCGVLMYQFGTTLPWAKAPGTTGPTAAAVGNASGWLNPNAAAAPIGAFHFWAIGSAGHVGMDLSGGGADVLMATKALRESWGSAIGVQSVAGYTKAKGATYRGWATNYGGGIPSIPAEPAPSASARKVGTVNARRRVSPEVTAAIGAVPLAAGSVHEVEGWRYGDNHLGQPWYSIGGLWSHGSAFTESSTRGLANLNPALPDPPVVVPEPVEPPAPEPEEPETGPIVVPEPPVEPVEPEEPPVVVIPEPEPPVVVEPPVVEPETPTPTPAPADSPWATIGAIILAVAGFIAGIVAWFNA